MDVGIDSGNFKSDAKSDKTSAENAGSNGKMNGGDPLTDSVGAGIASDVGFWTLIVGAVGSAFAAVFAYLRVTNEARLSEMKTSFDARITDIQAAAKELHETCDRQQKDIDQCTRDREELRINYAVLTKEMQFIKSKITDRP
jgi:uncharacterized membrane protein YhiD involved in acid resistance